MRPTRAGLIFTFLVSATFTILVAIDALGVVWLVLGPGTGAAVEIVASHFGERGPGQKAREKDPPPDVSGGAVQQQVETI